jgi:predicted kinase
VTLLVVVTGPPASGKTTIAERLAVEFSLPLVAKDGMKEVLYETLGAADVEASKRLGVTAFMLVWHVLDQELRAGRSVIAEGNFNAARAANLERLRERYTFDVIQIVCRAPREELRARYGSRSRHPGHFDQVRVQDDALFETDLYILPLDIPTTHVDTMQAEAYSAARETVRSALEREKTP